MEQGARWRWLTGAACLGFAAGCSGDGGAAPESAGEPSTFSELVTRYQDLERVTEEPIQFLDYGLCAIPQRGVHTPVHTAYGKLNVYVNERGLEPMAQEGERLFSPGSVIVKEKLDTVNALGLMRKPDEEGADWEFAYWEEGELYEDLPELDFCRQCHLTGEVPEGMEEFFDFSEVPTPLYLRTPRDSVFLTLPSSGDTATLSY